MKPVHPEFPVIAFIFLTAILLLFSSCDVYYFSQPQPYDKPDLYHFPQTFRGEWISEHADEVIIIEENFIQIISPASAKKVIKGIWPQKDSSGENVYPQYPFSIMQYDEVSKAHFRKDNYVLADTLIYEIKNNAFLAKGYTWKDNRDTIWYEVKDSFYIDLGRNAFLRQIDTNMFVLNIRSHLISGGVKQMHAGWWFVNILQLKKDGSIDYLTNSEKTDSLSCMIYESSSSERQDIFFMNCKWSAATIKTLLKTGYFDTTNFKNIRKD
ncbi:hypothetical protein [Lacibacter sediminis]|uniref:Uncharacterized protein n=1 Tax=Lacibacter sediminis TaxID=2760713 RepID=A0A7G5XBT6_9BACT|nr:hypothetical protein [Lacibacter sediminis]QNA42939.1 hypothetical protein H4075_12650 [Lacibacter sediminis]